MLKTQEFRTKDFVVRSTRSIEHQKCKYCVGRASHFFRIAFISQLFEVHGINNILT